MSSNIEEEKMAKRILVIEDDPIIAELQRDYLEANQFEVDIATNGLDGLSFALEREYALVLLDVMLPGKDGFELCREIRKAKDVPILLVTAKKESIDKIRGLGLGADDYIVKPFDPSELVARVKSHIARYMRLTSSDKTSPLVQTKENVKEIAIGSLRILPDAWRVFVEGEEAKLTNKEFELLLFLATNPNMVFSKDKLFDRIWGMDSLGDASTVTVHVNRLREKIEADNNNPKYIETVWGAGYRFNN